MSMKIDLKISVTHGNNYSNRELSINCKEYFIDRLPSINGKKLMV
jgi:hypothetical protein